jgi:DNA-binding NarL/FixJ family response regulator
VEEHPGAWATIAWGRWLSGDTSAADHWTTRVLHQRESAPDSVPLIQALCVRLHRTRSGGEPARKAVTAAQRALAPGQLLPGGDPFRSLLLLELGAGENWLGNLPQAEHHLSEAVMLSRAEGLPVVTAEALGHLALTLFMAGREVACMDVARQALDLCATTRGVLEATQARAEVALGLATFQDSPWAGTATDALAQLPAAPDDLAGRFWHWILSARLALRSGAPADAQQRIGTPPALPVLPGHLRVSLLVERALHALAVADPDTLRELAAQLGEAGATGESAWVDGALADLNGDLRRAATLYLDASRSDCREQPATAVLGLVSAAQLHDYLVEGPSLRDLLVRAVSATAPRRNAVPFQGWSSHGTRVGQLLQQVDEVGASEWGAELRSTFAEVPSVTSIFRRQMGTSRELGSVVEPTVRPVLSPREQEVLGELARGSTYSDIAANLFVSENTVKTHISSLYSKLAVGRRSEALAVARKLHLI